MEIVFGLLWLWTQLFPRGFAGEAARLYRWWPEFIPASQRRCSETASEEHDTLTPAKQISGMGLISQARPPRQDDEFHYSIELMLASGEATLQRVAQPSECKT